MAFAHTITIAVQSDGGTLQKFEGYFSKICLLCNKIAACFVWFLLLLHHSTSAKLVVTILHTHILKWTIRYFVHEEIRIATKVLKL